MNTRLTEEQVQALARIADQLYDLWHEIDADSEIELDIKENGTIGGNISCAVASLDTILQEY